MTPHRWVEFDFPVSFQHTLEIANGGAVAQLGERLNGIQEVVGSIPIGSTISLLTTILFFKPQTDRDIQCKTQSKRRHGSDTSPEVKMGQFYLGSEPLWAWVYSVFDR